MLDTWNNPWFFPFLLFFFFFFFIFSSKTHVFVTADTISTGQSLTGDQTIVSKGEKFVLGFFTPGKSLNYYIGIWYNMNKVTVQTVVWVANRESPLKDPSSSELKLLENGNLVLLDQSKITIWSTNSTSNTLNSSEVVLRDDGNLVLRNGLNKSDIVWQSFDYPTDTWLPGGKLNFNKHTNKSMQLTSWKSSENPAKGIFSLELDPDGTNQYFLQWNESRDHRYWSTGIWNGLIFSNIPEMRANHIHNFSYITNENEKYFTYNLYNNSIIYRFVLGLLGQVQQMSWLPETKEWSLFGSQPKLKCHVYAICGPFGSCDEANSNYCQCLEGFEPRSKDWNLSDRSLGCVRRTPLQCGMQDGFLPKSNMKWPENRWSLEVGSAKACELGCLNNCSCSAYSYGNGGCSVWSGDLLNVQKLSNGDNGGEDLYLRLAASELQSFGEKKKKASNTGVIVGAVVGTLGVLGLVLTLLCLWHTRRPIGTLKTVEGSLVVFTYRDLQTVTKNFSEKLGGGGFGSVFKGTLPDSTVIAVKKLEGLSQGEKQFRTEVSTIGSIQHVNLVRLRGFCSEGTKRLLVYDYMPKGSLDSQLFHQKDASNLDWKKRYQIALGTARGLAYLHEKCRDCIIHCDIKPENILLDADFVPIVADFGLAKLLGREFSRVLTTMRGTRGYLAPEWMSGAAITAKADVYSYGMMLFEVISGRRNLEQSNDGKFGFFPTWAATKMTEGEDVLTLVDLRLGGNADVEEVTRAFRVACWCIQDDEVHRPSMGQIVQILEGFLEVNPPPIPRYLQVLLENEANIHFFSESSNPSSQTRSTTSTSAQDKSSTSSKSSKS